MSANNSSNHLVEYLSFESKQQQQKSSSSDDTNNEDIGRHALDQLLESKLGNELTTSAQRLVAIHNNNNNNNGGVTISSSLLEEEVTKLMGTSAAFQQMSAQINACPLSLLLPSKQNTVNIMMSEENMIIGSNQKSNKSSTANATAAAANKPATAAVAVASFSLFDLMDSQKGGGTFTFPPRIMAHQVIDAYQQQQQQQQQQQHGGRSSNNGDCSHCKNNSNDDTIIQSTTNKTTTSSSALELLEQAEDMEDLSPDVESWEHIRSILYLGLTATTTNNNENGEEEERRGRYFKVHKSLFDKCRRNSGGGGGMMMFRTQTWGLTFNIVGFILNLSNEFDNKDEQKILKTDLDLYWDSCRYLLSSLSHLAMEYITSCVGYEKEIERMLLGLSYLLCKDGSACVLAMMEPLAGWFEVWARFVGPSKLLKILRVSGLGEVVLRRCECRGRNEASKRLYAMLLRRHDGSSSESSSPTLEDMENSNFLQSLSIIRVITCRCNVTLESMGWIFCCNAIVSASFFLSADGIASSDEVQTMLEKTGNDETEEFNDKSSSIVMQKEITARVLKPFHDVLLLKESSPGLVDANLEVLCTQTISLIEQSC